MCTYKTCALNNQTLQYKLTHNLGSPYLDIINELL